MNIRHSVADRERIENTTTYLDQCRTPKIDVSRSYLVRIPESLNLKKATRNQSLHCHLICILVISTEGGITNPNALVARCWHCPFFRYPREASRYFARIARLPDVV